MRTLFTVLALSVFYLPAWALEATLPRHPAPSPDGRQIAFSWQGDLWVVAAEGGAARRLTAHPAVDRHPVWSKDGRFLAFSSDRQGNLDVFVMPADASQPARRLTYASTNDTPVDFTPDGSAVLFTSARDESVLRSPGLYTVPVEGGSAVLLQRALGQTASFSPDGKRLVFVRGTSPWNRRGYRGSGNRQLWLREADGTYRRLSDFAGDEDAPGWVGDAALVFLSSRAGRKNVFRLDLAGGDPRPLTRHEGSDVRAPKISADGRLVAYEFEDAIWTVPAEGGDPRKLKIEVAADLVDNTIDRKVLREGAAELALSPDGKYAAFVVQGDIFLTSVRSKDDQEIASPPTVPITDTPAREKDLSWSPDGTRLLFSSDRGGSFDVWTARRADETRDWTENFDFRLVQLTTAPEEETQARFSPDGKSIAFQRGAGELVVMKDNGAEPRTLVRSFGPPGFDWSPDSRWIAYSQEDNWHNSEIFIIPAAGGTPYNLSRHPDVDLDPRWSPDGRRLIWLTKRHADTMDVWSVWLTKSDDERTAEEWLKIWKETKKDKPAAETPPAAKGTTSAPAKTPAPPPAPAAPPEVKIDFDRLWERIRLITDLKGDETLPRFADGGKRILFTAEADNERDLYSLRWDGKDLKRLTTGGKQPTAIQTDAAGANVFFLEKNGTVQRVALDGKAGDPVPFSARVAVDLPARRAAVFEEAWRAIRDNFYDPQFHGVDWVKAHDTYRPWALAASDPADFADMLNLMLGELNASHMGYYPAGAGGGEQTGFIGALFDPAAGGPGILVREVLDDSPAAKQNVRLQPGERIMTVSGRSVREDTDIYALFVDTVGQRVPLLIQGKDQAVREAVVIPVSLSEEQRLRHRQWVRQRRDMVERLSAGRLGYLHIPGMDMVSFETFERDLFAAASGKEGLIIDVRSNGGGWTMDYLMAVLEVRRHAWTRPRGVEDAVRAYPQDRLPFASWTRPALTLCNEESYSNAEIFSHAFKTLKRGLLVGTPTFGAVISTDETRLIDGARLRLPQRGWFSAAAGINMENNGAVPDLIVDRPPAEDTAGDRDTQLEEAVKAFLAGIEQDPRHGAW